MLAINGLIGEYAGRPNRHVERLKLLAGDPHRREEMGAAARATVLERFCLDSQVPRVLQLFADEAGRR